MPSEFELTVARFQTFLREAVEPLVYPGSFPVRVAVRQVTDPHAPLPTAAEMKEGVFTPVEPGWQWGPKWSTAWFLVQGTVPPMAQGLIPCLRFSSGTEAMVWRRVEGGWLPVQGLDVNRDRVSLSALHVVGDEFEVLIEAACNHPFGVVGFEWDTADTHARWKSDTPGRLERAEVAAFDRAAWLLRQRYAFALGLLKDLPADSNRARHLLGVLRRATNSLDVTHTAQGPKATAKNLEAAIALLDEGIRSPAGGAATKCIAVGHAHIDTAWLWPLRETRRKCLRTFTNQLRLMEEFPEYTFLCSQAQQYAWIEEDAPEVFEQIRARVREGRWEPGGGMWIEPDANCPSGESLARQIVLGAGYWQQTFGEKGKQSFLYLPDTFGFPGSIPQIMALCGLHTFITNKLHWNSVNTFPHSTFVWRGIDGTEVLAHNTPGKDYNATNTPRELRRGEHTHTLRDRAGSDGDTQSPGKAACPPVWLQPFGYGDGGGGPTDWSIEFARLAEDCEGLPRVTMGRADSFCERLLSQESAADGTPEALPVWWGELYLELHRGTLTTQAWIKEANRRAEESLRLAEALHAVSPSGWGGAAYPTAKLEKAWKLVLLNQFHDILPGSSIGWVYEDARRDFERVEKITDSLTDKGTTVWLSGLSTAGLAQPVGVFNQCSVHRDGVIELDDDTLMLAKDVPALGVRVIDAAATPMCVPVTIDGGRLSNGVVTAEIDDLGRVASLRREGCGVDLAGSWRGHHGLNILALFEDLPHMWDAWDIDPSFEHKARVIDTPPEAIEVVQESPLRGAIRVRRSLGEASSIEQVYTLSAASPRLDVHTRIEWRERRRLLRALFPTPILAPLATYEIQFGHVQRPTHRNTPWDAAMFEVCAHRWADISERGAGLALLNDSKYGHSCCEGMLGLSLLRSPVHPDPQADQGTHEFTYSLMPHEGDWRAAGVDREAEALNTPMIAYRLNAGESGPAGGHWSPLSLCCDGGASVAISALKKAEDGNGIILRVWECHGGRGTLRIRWNAPVSGVEATDLLERPMALDGFSHSGAETLLPLRPFQIVSLRALPG